ncbi:MAG: TrkA family potassium uptake protein [Anaerolineales bacterium]|nr:TrkA family potassium uptake protein [Anaerolineales bacterium]
MSRQKDHEYAIIGLGQFGYHLALALEENDHTVMAIDIDPQLVQAIVDQVTHAATLDCSNEDALRDIDIGSFDTVVVAIGNDFEANLLTTVNLKNLGVRRIICKAQTSRQCDILLRLGADKVIQPEQSSARRLAEELSTPAMIDHFNLGQGYSIAEVVLPDSLAWQSLAQIDLRNTYQITVLLVKRGDEVHISPRADTILQKDDILVLFGKNEHVNQFGNLS